MVALDEEDKVT